MYHLPSGCIHPFFPWSNRNWGCCSGPPRAGGLGFRSERDRRDAGGHGRAPGRRYCGEHGQRNVPFQVCLLLLLMLLLPVGDNGSLLHSSSSQWLAESLTGYYGHHRRRRLQSVLSYTEHYWCHSSKQCGRSTCFLGKWHVYTGLLPARGW